MRMHLDGFVKQDRGPRLFDSWQWPDRVSTKLGDLVVELITGNGEGPPNKAMVDVASELAAFAIDNGELLLDLIYGHYKNAEQNKWLDFWGVKSGLRKDEILSRTSCIALVVNKEASGPPDAAVFVDPEWDPEHKLDLNFAEGRIAAVNGDQYILDGEVLRRA